MKKNCTEVVFILDRSGSMSGLESDTVGGFNAMLEKQKKEEGETLISVVLFDDISEVLYDRVELHKVEPMNDRQYYVRGCTALHDAIGGAIERISIVHRYAREEDRPEKTLFVITTDGLENASRMYSGEKIRKLITEKQKNDGWEFLFLGANIDAVTVAGGLGIHANRAVNYECDGVGTALNFEAMAGTVSAVKRSRNKKELDEMISCVCEPVRAHYEEKHGKDGR